MLCSPCPQHFSITVTFKLTLARLVVTNPAPLGGPDESNDGLKGSASVFNRAEPFGTAYCGEHRSVSIRGFFGALTLGFTLEYLAVGSIQVFTSRHRVTIGAVALGVSVHSTGSLQRADWEFPWQA